LDPSRAVAQDGDDQRVEPLDGIRVLLVGAEFLGVLLDRGGHRQGHVQHDIPFDRRWSEGQDEERQQLEGHVEHGRQVQLDFALSSSFSAV
jgi:hypothetical protein